MLELVTNPINATAVQAYAAAASHFVTLAALIAIYSNVRLTRNIARGTAESAAATQATALAALPRCVDLGPGRQEPRER